MYAKKNTLNVLKNIDFHQRPISDYELRIFFKKVVVAFAIRKYFFNSIILCTRQLLKGQ